MTLDTPHYMCNYSIFQMEFRSNMKEHDNKYKKTANKSTLKTYKTKNITKKKKNNLIKQQNYNKDSSSIFPFT